MDLSKLGQMLDLVGQNDFKCSLVVNLRTHRTQVLIDTNELITIHTNWNQMCTLIDNAVHIIIAKKEFSRKGDQMWHEYKGDTVLTDSDVRVDNDIVTILY